MTYIGWTKNIDTAALRSTNQISGRLSVNNLKGVDVINVFRASGTSTAIYADFGEEIDINATMLVGINTETLQRQVRLSNTDSTGVAGEVYDSGSATVDGEEYDPIKGLFVHTMGQTYSARFLRIDFSDPMASVPNIEAGRWWAGNAFIPNVSFQYGWQLGREDLSQRQFSPGGQLLVNPRPNRQVINAVFHALDDTEVHNFADMLLNDVGLQSDLLIIPDGVQSRRAFESVWGYLESLRPRTHRTIRHFQYRLTIKERK